MTHNCSLGHLFQGNEGLSNYKMNIYCNFIPNSQNLATIQMCFTGWMTKQIVVHLCNEIVLSNKKKDELLIPRRTWMQLERIILSEQKPTSKGCILCDSILITFLKWQNYRNGEWANGCQRLRRHRNGREVGDTIKEQQKGSFCERIVLYLVCIHVHILIVLLSRVVHTLGRTWVKGTWDLCTIS